MTTEEKLEIIRSRITPLDYEILNSSEKYLTFDEVISEIYDAQERNEAFVKLSGQITPATKEKLMPMFKIGVGVDTETFKPTPMIFWFS